MGPTFWVTSAPSTGSWARVSPGRTIVNRPVLFVARMMRTSRVGSRLASAVVRGTMNGDRLAPAVGFLVLLALSLVIALKLRVRRHRRRPRTRTEGSR